MADLDEKNSSGSVKLSGANPSTGIETNYLDIDSTGRPTVKLNDGSGNTLSSLSGALHTQELNHMYYVIGLRNGTSETMTVNGSGTPVNFDYAPTSGTWYVESLQMFMQASGTPDPGDFGAIAGGITNGVELRIRSAGTEYLVTTLTNNMQLFGLFSNFPGLVPTTGGWWNSKDTYHGVCTFIKPIVLQFSTTDYIRMIVRDNLTSIDNFRVYVKLRRLI